MKTPCAPGTLNGPSALNNLINGDRDPGMKAAVIEDVRNTCWANGWDIYNYFAAEGGVSRYGPWGACENFDSSELNPGSPKLQAIYELTGNTPKSLDEWVASAEHVPAVDHARLDYYPKPPAADVEA